MFSRREKALIVVAAIAVVVAVAAQFVGGYARGREIDESLVTREWRNAKKSVSALEARLAETTVAAPDAVPQLLRAAQASGAAAGATLASVRPRRPLKMESGIQQNAIEIQARGRFPAIVTLMNDIQEKNPHVILSRVSISSADGASDAVNCTLVVASFSPMEVEK